MTIKSLRQHTYLGRFFLPVTALVLLFTVHSALAYAPEHQEPGGQLAAAPQAVVIEATMRDALQVDNDSDTNADPGDTLRYTVAISNTGDTSATGVAFSDTLDANTTLVPGSVNASPLAFDDSYTAVGNTLLQVCNSKTETSAVFDSNLLTANDTEFFGDSFTVTAMDAASVQGGAITNDGDGCFRYLPPVGYTGNDSFSYTISDDGVGGSNALSGTRPAGTA